VQTNYYKTLGVTHGATAEEIRVAYDRLIETIGPNARQDPAVTHRVAEIKAAYEVLSDANRRTLYDLESMERDLAASDRELTSDFFGPPSAVTPPGTPEENDADFARELAAVLAELERPRPAKSRSPAADATPPTQPMVKPRRGADREIILDVTLEEAARGASVNATFPVGPNGNGTEQSTRTVEVHLPKLARHGQKLVLKGLGFPGTDGGESGDLHVDIAYKRHRLFRVNGDDIWYHFPITPWEAVLGAIVQLPTLDAPLKVRVPAGTTSGQTFRLPGRGLRKMSGGRGDLLACLRIVTPQFPTEVEKLVYLQLSRISRFNPRRGFG
jgi:curved DNA-binding protein